MSDVIRQASDEATRAASVFTELSRAIGNTDYSAEQFNGRMQGFAKVMAYTNKIGYATLPFYFRLKNRVETSLLAIGKFSEALKGQNDQVGLLGKSFKALGSQYQKAKSILGPSFSRTLRTSQDRMRPPQYDTSVSQKSKKQMAMESLDYLSFGLAGKSAKLGASIMGFIKMQNKGRVFNQKLYKIGAKANEKVNEYYTKIKGVPVRKIMLSLGSFLLFGLKALIILTLAMTALIILFKSKAVQNTVRRIMDILMEVGSVIFDALKTVFDGFMLIFKALMGGEGFMKSLGMVLKGLGKIFFGILKGLFGVAFVVLKGLLKVVIGAIYDVGSYIVQGLANAFGFVAKAGKFIGNIMMPGTPFAMARGGVSSGGMTLVGEEGPELVRLPTGARVYSNQQSRRMATGTTNNITVNVQGRIGASDTELRQIASKIGQMINKEVNRTTSSRGTLG